MSVMQWNVRVMREGQAQHIGQVAEDSDQVGREVERLGLVRRGCLGVGEDVIDGLGDRAAGGDNGVVHYCFDLLVACDCRVERGEQTGHGDS